MTKLSVNVNKIATLRNARGGNNPDLILAVERLEAFGAQGITVHPRPDERHIRYSDVREIKQVVTTELNIEGYPSEAFIDLVLEVRPTQVTLVPDSPEQLTSNHGWQIRPNEVLLEKCIAQFHEAGIRVSLFVDPDERLVEDAQNIGADRVELYTEPYASLYATDPHKAIAPYLRAAEVAKSLSIGLNAGHDLSLQNLQFFHQSIPWTDEVSIGHALICDALYLGLEQTVKSYLLKLQ